MTLPYILCVCKKQHNCLPSATTGNDVGTQVSGFSNGIADSFNGGILLCVCFIGISGGVYDVTMSGSQYLGNVMGSFYGRN